jgi:SPP1 family predicted phage head-tail adaptor
MYNKGENIGKLNKRVVLEQYLTASDDYNAETKVWVSSDPIWASIEYTTARSDEDAIAQRIVSRLYALIVMRYRRDVYPNFRVKHEDARFNILSILPDDKRKYMRLECVMDEPRSSQSYVDPAGLDWVDQNGSYWEWSGSKDEQSEVSVGETWTDDSGIVWNRKQ